MMDDTSGSPPLVDPALNGVPETMLWTLYARATLGNVEGGLLHDPWASRIRDAIDYDFEGRFGAPNKYFAVRAALIDGVIRRWLARHPNGTVVSLGEGLETQRHRVDNGEVQWVTVDLPEAIRLRETFIKPGSRAKHFAGSAIEQGWMESIGRPQALFVIAQGLLMYFEPSEVRQLLLEIGRRFPGVELVFDVVDRDLSESTLRGHQQGVGYTLPPMHWALNRDEILPTLRNWKIDFKAINFLPYRVHRRYPVIMEHLLDRIVPRRRRLPSLIHLRL